MNLKFQNSTKVGQTCRSALKSGRRGNAALPRCTAFTLIEVLVVVVLMSFIILALMTVFDSTQKAFRASLTQTDVLEGGRSAMGMIKSDLEGMTPSFGRSTNQANLGFLIDGYGWSTVPVNFWVNTNYWQYQSNAAPLLQSMIGSTSLRTNVLESFFILTRQNLTWTGVGYTVDTGSTNYFNPLYRFSMSTNVQAADPTMLFNVFLSAINNGIYTNMSHLMDGVVDLRVRAYGLGGIWMTNLPTYYYDPVFVQMTNDFSKNVWFSLPQWTLEGEVGFYMFSNTLPASVEINLGVLEDRAIQRALSLPDGVAVSWVRSNYLAQQSGKVHVFRQRVWIRNVDPTAYQP